MPNTFELTWDTVGEREYETGVDRGVLFPQADDGTYRAGVSWSGLTAVNENPEGAEASDQYADNIKYLSLRSAETFGATIEAFTAPDEFAECDGSAEIAPGVYLGQQKRRPFGFAYRTKLGNDVMGDDYGYKIHLVYGATAAPSAKNYQTVNESPEAMSLSWEVKTVPVNVEGYKPTATITIDSTKVSASILSDIETILYGTTEGDVPVHARLPLPAEILSIIAGTNNSGSDTPGENNGGETPGENNGGEETNP